MPLLHAKTEAEVEEVVSRNMRILQEENRKKPKKDRRPQDQMAAIAYSEARKNLEK